MQEVDFWQCTPKLFGLYVDNYRKREERKDQIKWEQIRWQTAALLSPHSKKSLAPTDLIKFPWETTETATFTLPDNWKAITKAMDSQAKEDGLI